MPAELKRKYPDRFMFVASLPLLDVDAAIAEAYKKYKQGTLHMVKNLQLLDQKELNPANHIINFISK